MSVPSQDHILQSVIYQECYNYRLNQSTKAFVSQANACVHVYKYGNRPFQYNCGTAKILWELSGNVMFPAK